MPTRNGLASASLTYTQKGGGPFHVALRVWSHSYDDPDPARRNALIKKVKLAQLTGTNHPLSNARITDRYGIDETGLWAPDPGPGTAEEGFSDYTEWDSSAHCRPGFGVIWGSYTGIYDERCLADPACDAMRFQTYLSVPPNQITVFNYLLGPVTFTFNIAQPAPPKAVKLVMGQIGGNGGNPAQRVAVFPDEEFVIQFP